MDTITWIQTKTFLPQANNSSALVHKIILPMQGLTTYYLVNKYIYKKFYQFIAMTSFLQSYSLFYFLVVS